MESIISCEAVAYSYRKDETAVRDLTLQINRGLITGVLGHNGSGKTTLFRLMAGLLKPDRGKITFDGQLLARVPRSALYRKLGLMIETPVFYDHLTVVDNLRLQQRYRSVRKERIEEVLVLTGADGFIKKKAGSLSTGMRQRAGLAAALLQDPEVLILDEPTNGLDPDGVIQIRELLLAMKQKGRTIILSSHMLPEMQRVCDRLVILRQGRQVFQGSMEETGTFRDLEELYVSLQSGGHE